MTLQVSERLRTCVRHRYMAGNLLGNVYLTKEGDMNMGISARPNVARDKGADIFLSIHFNGGPSTVRGSEVWIHPQDKPGGQYNFSQDETLATRLSLAIASEIGTNNRGVKQYRDKTVIPSGVYNDAQLGTQIPGNPIRAALAELEFIENTEADTWFNGEGSGARVLMLSGSIANVLIRDLQTQP